MVNWLHDNLRCNLIGTPLLLCAFAGFLKAMVSLDINALYWSLIFLVAGFFFSLDGLLDPSPQTAEAAGAFGEARVVQAVKSMIGTEVDGYITSSNIVHNGKNFEIDCLALVPEFGLVLMEVKYYSGKVTCTAGQWLRTNRRGETEEMGNASRQVLRTERLLKTLLKSDKLDRWPITSVVIHAHPEVALRYGDGENAPQTDIVPLAHLHSYLSELPRDPSIHFTREDFEALRTAIKQNEKAYEAAPMYKRASA